MRSAVLATCLLALAAGCAKGTLIFGVGPSSDTITVSGTINNTTPVNATRDIVVFVYTDLADPGTFSSFGDAESVVVAAGSTSFELSGVSPGDLTVVFLLDESTPDGTIDPGDLYATLDDPSGFLESVPGNRRVELDAVDIVFEADADGGTATADTIRVVSAE
ncbi:MAG: hypothetical protein D6760_09305 [Deltaproteobacteria bacterium]|nr:MAG: hypothetical protein D6760_09305 [Deltaproteobacteria bacterium]